MMCTRKERMNRALICAVSLLLAPAAFSQALLPSSAASRSSRPTTIVIAFVGGFVRHNDMVHGTVQLAARLRSEYPEGVTVKVFENHHEDEAYRAVLHLLDADHDGSPSTAEKENARIVIFGHSWGGSETVRLARQLGKAGIPVLLTVQVDSIQKTHENDAVIPPNVREAANFYQPDGLLHGRPDIRAADPSRTKILGNFRFDYKTNPITCDDKYPLINRVFMKTHTEIECDPKVWNEVESLVKSNLPDSEHSSSTGG
jgi:hypothetical protein